VTAPVREVPVVLALGTNLGDREAVLRSAVAALAAVEGLDLRRVSPVVETDPVGGPEQPDYLNAVVLAGTRLGPLELLRACQRVEAEHDRVREVRWGPRTLDVDVVAYGSATSDDPVLTLPHPRAHERAFVLVPWSAADPDAVLPGPAGGRVAELAGRAPDRAGVRARDDLVLEVPR
jgi:dihydroneopterin aldolase/2-amino-4-hydroxy-6-hydroxymethyldihydropteridine diphosphokinase